jgi:hypothetical protein
MALTAPALTATANIGSTVMLLWLWSATGAAGAC